MPRPSSSVATTEAEAESSSEPSGGGDQLSSLPTFQTTTLRGPSSCVTPTPRGIITRPSNSPRSAVPTPLALQNIEGERLRMFGSGNVLSFMGRYVRIRHGQYRTPATILSRKQIQTVSVCKVLSRFFRCVLASL